MNSCKVCGENVNDNFNYCPSCGADLKKKSKSSKKPLYEKVELKQEISKNKTIPIQKVLYSVLSLLILGLIILYLSGVFDSFKSSKTEIDQTAPHSGVNLSNLQEINNLEEKVKNNPEDFESLLTLAHLLNDSGLKEKAIDKYQIYLKKFPKEADVLVDMGVCYYEIGKNQNAIMYMEQALKYKPNHQIANLNLGIVNSSMENFAIAKKYWQKAIEINPNNEIGKKAEELIKSH